MLARICSATFCLFVLVCISPAAWAVKLGPQFHVNSFTNNEQSSPSVAPLKNGGFVVVWQSRGQDGSSYGIYGRLFKGISTPAGAEFQINTYTKESQSSPSVAGLDDGRFVVVWSSDGQDGSDGGVYAQLFNALGKRVGKEFRVNSATAGDQIDPAVAALSGGGFVIVWKSNSLVRGQRFRPNGTRLGGEFQIIPAWSAEKPSVAGLAGSGFVVTWWSYDQYGNQIYIYARRYRANGAPAGGEFEVDATGVGPTHSVAALHDGGFVVAYGNFQSSWWQRYTDRAVRVGQPVAFCYFCPSYDTSPAVAALRNGGFVIGWQVSKYSNHGRTPPDVYGQWYDATGLGGEAFRANSYTPYHQDSPSVAGLTDGTFVIVWQSKRQGSGYGVEGSGYGVYGQRFKIP